VAFEGGWCFSPWLRWLKNEFWWKFWGDFLVSALVCFWPGFCGSECLTVAAVAAVAEQTRFCYMGYTSLCFCHLLAPSGLSIYSQNYPKPKPYFQDETPLPSTHNASRWSFTSNSYHKMVSCTCWPLKVPQKDLEETTKNKISWDFGRFGGRFFCICGVSEKIFDMLQHNSTLTTTVPNMASIGPMAAENDTHQ